MRLQERRAGLALRARARVCVRARVAATRPSVDL